MVTKFLIIIIIIFLIFVAIKKSILISNYVFKL